MKILHINCNYMGTKLHQIMIEHLNKYTNENVIYCPIYKGSRIVTKPNENVIVSRCFNIFDRLFYFNKQKKIYKDIIGRINVNDFNIIHAYTLFTDGNVAYNLHNKYDIPYVVAIRGTDVDYFYRYKFYLKKRGEKILKNAKKIFFLSDSYRKVMMNNYISEKFKEELLEKSIIIPNGIDDFWLNNTFNDKNLEQINKRINKKKIKILLVGKISKIKNIDFAIKVVHKLAEEGWTVSFDVVGEIEDYRYFNKLKKSNLFNYLGEMNKENLLKCYREHDIFLLPSKTETFGLVYAEAMSQGLPVIYTKNQGFDNQFEDGTIGYSINIQDLNCCIDSINKICSNYDYYYYNCIKAVKKFNWNDICNDYIKVYEEKSK